VVNREYDVLVRRLLEQWLNVGHVRFVGFFSSSSSGFSLNNFFFDLL
jgi:hypothetical protein